MRRSPRLPRVCVELGHRLFWPHSILVVINIQVLAVKDRQTLSKPQVMDGSRGQREAALPFRDHHLMHPSQIRGKMHLS